MLYKATIAILAATLAVAAPSKRQSEPDLLVSLTNTVLAVTAEYYTYTDGTPVAVDFTHSVDEATVQCLGVCIPEYHCTLYDEAFTPIIVLPPGTSQIGPDRQVGLIICGSGLPETKREVLSEAPAAG